MKMMNLKRSLWLTVILLSSLCAGAQTKSNTYRITDKNGKRVESVQTDYDGKHYQIEWMNEKMTGLSVDGVTIPEADWSKYSTASSHIRQDLKEQAKRNNAQAARNAAQASLNEEQAVRNKAQARLNTEQQERNAEQAVRNKAQARENAEQQKRNEAQALLNQEQSGKNDAQAKAMEALMKAITKDLVNDHIIKDENDLRQLNFNGPGLFVNGIRQPEAVAKKYHAKYSKDKYGLLYDHFNYDRDGVIKGD
ncbi:hypothetical protein GWR56_01800 [Mucilaginibacter sp. 14171R-50]|uniref:hypothetical protein n=1 Tax=Mucilaginibacter sp. 14171R-50 TaxID=2703789 RepID=UPI00138BA3A0|nr:hypothetical protein [Mucilaginibacter sp. 14171R-50]QHS54336.1 hypothetical protein GWR56_01800 [Mucilaginibacter sp. 14171R-50]